MNFFAACGVTAAGGIEEPHGEETEGGRTARLAPPAVRWTLIPTDAHRMPAAAPLCGRSGRFRVRRPRRETGLRDWLKVLMRRPREQAS